MTGPDGQVSQRPDLFVIMAERLRPDALGYTGLAQVPTPMLDRLASRSLCFDRHFTPCPVPVPARAALLTGLLPLRSGVIHQGLVASEARHACLPADAPVLLQRLADSGYRVVHAGAQPLRVRQPQRPEESESLERRCPEVQFLGPASLREHLADLAGLDLMLPDLDIVREPVVEYDRGRPVAGFTWGMRSCEFPLREDHFWDHRIVQQAIQAIEQLGPRTPQSPPVAVFVMLGLPQPPLWVPRRYAEVIAPEAVRLPPTTGRWCAGMAATQLLNVTGQLGARLSQEDWRHSWAAYLGQVAFLDALVGRLLAAIDHVGRFEPGLVAFTAASGEMLGSHRLAGGACLYESAVRVPLLLKLPGDMAGAVGPGAGGMRRVQELTDHRDLHATLCQAAGLPRSQGEVAAAGLTGQPLQGCVMLPGSEAGWQARDHLVVTYDGWGSRAHPARMLRTRTHKLIHNLGAYPELYDLVEDPRETSNILASEAARELRRGLRQVLARELDELGDELPRYGP